MLLPAALAVDPQAETSVATAVSATLPVRSPGSKLVVTEGEEEGVPSGTDLSLEDLLVIATPDYQASPEFTLTPNRLSYPLDDLICSACKHIVNRAVETPCCHQLFCAECTWAWLDTAVTCPTCRKNLLASKLVPLHPRLSGILSQVQVQCDFATSLEKLTCTALVPLRHLVHHVASCQFRPGGPPHSPIRKVLTRSSTVGDLLEYTPSKLKGDVARRATARLALAQMEEGVLEFHTGGGKPQTLKRVTKRETKSPSDTTLWRHSSETAGLRTLVSGGAAGSATLLARELRQMDEKDQDKLLQEAGLKAEALTARDAGLALKADLHLPWYKVRKIRKWLAEWGVTLQSEPQMRQQLAKELPFELSAEMVPLANKGGTVEMKPVVRFPDVVDLIHHYLAQHQAARSLCWHDGALPADEIWVKIGGDRGGGSFKFSFQLANVKSPNAKQNIIPFLVFAAPDSPGNLSTTLTPYAEQVARLAATPWEGKKVQLIFFGDYELICACYGLSGASGVHRCLFCQITKKDMQRPVEAAPARSLDSLEQDFAAYQASGSRLTKAKYFNNVIRPAFLPVPLDWVCIPALHLDLGIFVWLFV